MFTLSGDLPERGGGAVTSTRDASRAATPANRYPASGGAIEESSETLDGRGAGVSPLNPSVTFLEDHHRHVYGDEGIEVLLDRFVEDRRSGLMAEITITTSREPKPGLLHHGRLNLISSRSRADIIKALEQRVDGNFLTDVDFCAILEQLCFRSLRRWREGDPTVDLREVQLGEKLGWIIEDILGAGATNWFGDGGSGKSTLADAATISVASGVPIIGDVLVDPTPSLNLDWETDEHDHAEKYRAICAGAGITERPPVYYRRMVASLVESAPTIRKEIAKLGIGFVVVDSLGAARGGDPESAESTIRLFNAARSLGIPWLGIDHVPKNATDKGRSRPFGSTYTHNLARLTWGIEKAQEEGSDELVIALTNHKANRGRLARRRAYRARFENGEDGSINSITFEPTDVRDIPDLAKRLPVKARILNSLRDGRMTTETVAAAAEVGNDEARARLNDLRREGKVVRLDQDWGLHV